MKNKHNFKNAINTLMVSALMVSVISTINVFGADSAKPEGPHKFFSTNSISKNLFATTLEPAEGDYTPSAHVPADTAALGSPVLFNGQPLAITGEILVIHDIQYYPFREVMEGIGATVDWDGTTKTAAATINGKTVEFTVGSNQYAVVSSEHPVDGRTIRMYDAQFIVNDGRTYVPIAYPLESLGFIIIWDHSTDSIVIN